MCYLIDVCWLIVVFRFSIILPNKSSVINMFLIICTLFFYSTRIMPGYSDCHLVLGLFPWLVGANKPPAFPKDRPGSKMNLLASQSVRIFAAFSQSIPSSPIGAPIPLFGNPSPSAPSPLLYRAHPKLCRQYKLRRAPLRRWRRDLRQPRNDNFIVISLNLDSRVTRIASDFLDGGVVAVTAVHGLSGESQHWRRQQG